MNTKNLIACAVVGVLAAAFGTIYGLTHAEPPPCPACPETPVEDVEQHIRVIYDVTSGIRIQADKNTIVQKIACFDGDPSRKCVWISCPKCETKAKEAADDDAPIASAEPTG